MPPSPPGSATGVVRLGAAIAVTGASNTTRSRRSIILIRLFYRVTRVRTAGSIVFLVVRLRWRRGRRRLQSGLAAGRPGNRERCAPAGRTDLIVEPDPDVCADRECLDGRRDHTQPRLERARPCPLTDAVADRAEQLAGEL